MMRTTLTLDEDVAARLSQLRDKRKTSLKDLVNEALRAGLDQLEKRPERRRYRIKARAVKPRITNLDNIAEVLATHEGEDWR